MSSDDRSDGTADRYAEIAALRARGLTQHEIAQHLGTSERTIRRCMAQPAFTSALARARRLRMQEFSGRATELADGALAVLADLMNEEHRGSVRLGAARAVLGLITRIEADELADRIDRLERAVLSETGWTPDTFDGDDDDDDDDDDIDP